MDVTAGSFAEMVNGFIGQRFPGFKPNQFSGVCDPTAVYKHDSAESAWAEIMSAKTGIRFQPAATNSLLPRLEAVRGPLRTSLDAGAPQFLIGPDMKVLRKALNAKYQYRRVQSANGAKYMDEPDKGHPWSDVADSMQYAHLHMGGGHQAEARLSAAGGLGRPIVARADFRVL
jgi:hypothetical protein